jgi:hypothetical protein
MDSKQRKSNDKINTKDSNLPKTSSDSEKKINFTISHLGIIRMFAMWGILDAIINIFTQKNHSKSLIIYIILFTIITSSGYIYPNMINFL